MTVLPLGISVGSTSIHCHMSAPASSVPKKDVLRYHMPSTPVNVLSEPQVPKLAPGGSGFS